MLQLVARMGALHAGVDGGRLLLPPDVKSFNADNTRLLLDANLERNGLLKTSEQAQGVQQIVVVQRPALDHVAFFRAPNGEGALYSVPTLALTTQMLARGYVRVYLQHLSDDTILPPRIVSEMPGAKRARSLAPIDLTLPTNGLPNADNKLGGESAADQIVREWELYVQIGEQISSPCRQWTLLARNDAKFGQNQNDNFCQRAKVYCFLKSGSQEADAAIADRLGLGDLKKAASTWASAAFKGAKLPKWADAATLRAQEAATAPVTD